MLDISRPLFAFARCHRVMNEGYLYQQESHGKRSAPTAATRPGADPALSLFWSRYDRGTCEYVDDLREHLREAGARTRKGAAISMHLLLGVSPEWLQETGGIHDGRNSRVIRLFEEAKAFAEKHITGVYAIRVDLDERGSGVVDVFAAPVHMRRARLRKDGTRGTDVCEVSVKDALLRMQKSAGGGKTYAALQTLWAHHAATTMDRRILRGVPKTITGREHLSVAEYRESVEKEKAWKAEWLGKRATVLNTFASLAERDDEASARERQLDAKEAKLTAGTMHLADEYGRLRDADAILAQRGAIIEARVADIERREEGNAREIDALAYDRREVETEKARVKAEQDARDELLAEKARRLAADEEANRIAASDTADRQRQLDLRIADAAAKEEELERRERRLTLAADEARRQRDEADVRMRRAEAEDIRLRNEERRASEVAEGMRLREITIVGRETSLERLMQVAQGAELARQTEYRERERQARDAEANLQARERELGIRAQDAARMRALAVQRIEAARVEREALAHERQAQADRSSDLAAREAAIVQVKQSIIDRERGLAATAVALEQGLRDIVDGRINTTADIVARPELTPAVGLLRLAGSAIARRVKQATAAVETRGAALAVERQQAQAAREEAEKSATTARQAEARYKEATRKLLSELKRLRRIRDLAKAIIPYVDHPSLQQFAPKLISLLKEVQAGLGASAGPDRER